MANVNDNLEIRITGEGTQEEIVKALRSIADSLEVGDHINALTEKGIVRWEDATLFTEIWD